MCLAVPGKIDYFVADDPEAMKMERPILTSNLSFATTVCDEAALYFDNLNPKDIATKIMKLFHDEQLYKDLVKKGKERLSIFDDSKVQTIKYLQICKKISQLNS